MLNYIKTQLEDHCRVINNIENSMSDSISKFVNILCDSLSSGNKLLVMGNGGSAADAQHFAAEIVGRFKMERRALPAIALSTDTSILTAIGNDYGFEKIFVRQVEALAEQGDIVVGISTSGNSLNVQLALEAANSIGCRTVGLLGRDGGSISGVAELSLIVPSIDTPRIQEGHITIIHIVCDLLEKTLFK